MLKTRTTSDAEAATVGLTAALSRAAHCYYLVTRRVTPRESESLCEEDFRAADQVLFSVSWSQTMLCRKLLVPRYRTTTGEKDLLSDGWTQKNFKVASLSPPPPAPQSQSPAVTRQRRQREAAGEEWRIVTTGPYSSAYNGWIVLIKHCSGSLIANK